MCRNIRTLSNFEPPATRDEIQAAALQYVRKVSGTTHPSKANEVAFARAVQAMSVGALLHHQPAGVVGQRAAQVDARRLLVVDDQGADRHATSA